ncbi:hypothetical protein QVD17_16616 [Tagetes erecta]|uniref:Retrotransposon gag domain-containing protein n=1 Tax=Tagetes erecta TaxID=13708 RepID=A0AAD8KR59_TARER|nr:hypothetical protein QVD17_16614 [Tagetes erecta]KAK1427895.1 hypothetical protein QVD17_16616 [Tagetes erecta]
MAPKRVTRSSAKATNAKATKVPEAKRGRKPTKKNVETNPEVEAEVTPTPELEQNLKDAVAHEVHKDDEEEEESEKVEREIESSDDSDFEIEGKGCNYGAFQRCKPPTFDGKKGSAATLEWLSEMEAVINISECRTDQAVKFVAHSFTGAANYWWTTVKQSKGRKAIREMVWEDLKELMVKRFCPQYEVDRVEREFLNLTAGSMSHLEYTTKFNEMAQLVPYLVETEQRRIKCYVQGLPPRVRTHVNAHRPGTFESVVDLAGIVYDNVAAEEVMDVKPMHWDNSRNQSGKRYRDDGRKYDNKRVKVEAKQAVVRNQNGNDNCAKCGKPHFGECKWGT